MYLFGKVPGGPRFSVKKLFLPSLLVTLLCIVVVPESGRFGHGATRCNGRFGHGNQPYCIGKCARAGFRFQQTAQVFEKPSTGLNVAGRQVALDSV